ncbi:MAG: hypothetical protein NTU73_03790 [Ignavibacteriae bacterium]|nr:hypothetical protein [Ignavibacteriota bacterium]
MRFLKFTVLIFILIFSVNITNAGTDISGKVLDERYFPVPGLTLFFTGGVSTKTNNDGKFKITLDKSTYDVFIYDYSNLNGAVYRNLTTPTPELTLFGSTSSKYVNTDIMKVNFNPVPQGKTVIIKFISDQIFSSKEVVASSGEKTKLITVDYPSTKDYINGRIIYLEKSPQSYDKFSEKSVTIMKDNLTQSVMFDSNSYYSKPGDSYLTIYLPGQESEKKSFDVYADFLSLHRNSELLMNTTEGDIVSTKILVPQTLPYGYRIKITGSCQFKGGSGYDSYFYSYPGASYNINSEIPPLLDSPQDKLYTVNDNTIFSYEWGSGTGVYVVHFHCFDPVGDFYVVTTDRNIKSPLSSVKDILKGTEFSWTVSKYLTYVSMDSFVRPKDFANDVGYRAITYSNMRTFRTKF